MIHDRIVLFSDGKNASNLNDRLDHIRVIFKRSWYFGTGVIRKEEKMKKERNRRWIEIEERKSWKKSIFYLPKRRWMEKLKKYRIKIEIEEERVEEI